LETARAHALYRENIDIFYNNLEMLFNLYNYHAGKIWNCDKTRAHAGKDGGGMVIAKRGSHS
jgi:hypothetical protein